MPGHGVCALMPPILQRCLCHSSLSCHTDALVLRNRLGRVGLLFSLQWGKPIPDSYCCSCTTAFTWIIYHKQTLEIEIPPQCSAFRFCSRTFIRQNGTTRMESRIVHIRQWRIPQRTFPLLLFFSASQAQLNKYMSRNPAFKTTAESAELPKERPKMSTTAVSCFHKMQRHSPPKVICLSSA